MAEIFLRKRRVPIDGGTVLNKGSQLATETPIKSATKYSSIFDDLIEACYPDTADEGIPSTPPNCNLNPRKVKRFLHMINPVKQFLLLKLISSDIFLARSNPTLRALHAAIELSKELATMVSRVNQ